MFVGVENLVFLFYFFSLFGTLIIKRKSDYLYYD